MHMVSEAGDGSEGGGTGAQELPMGGVWTVAAVEAVDVSGGVGGWKTAGQKGGRRWIREGASRWRPVGPVNELGEKPKGVTLLDMMPRKVEIKNRFEELDEEEEVMVIGEVAEADVETEVVAGVVEVMVDSGASKSVWPREMSGVSRRKGGAGVKLAAANGSPIKVEGEASLHFRAGGRKCTMNFVDVDVRRPLGAVSAIVDGGNIVVFSPSGSRIENGKTGERIPLVRKGGGYVMAVEVDGESWRGQGGRQTIGGVEVEEREESGGDRGIVFMDRMAEEDMGVFRRRA